MKLNTKWGYGQLFGYSAVDGPNRYYEDCILMTMKKKLEFRFEFRPHYALLYFPLKNASIKALMSDFLIANSKEGELKFTFLDNDTLVGTSPVLPILKGEPKFFSYHKDRNVDIMKVDNRYFGFLYSKMENGLYRFVIHHSFSSSEARSACNRYLPIFDIDALLEQRIAYYKQMPKCVNKKYESLYYKSLSIQKVNIHSAEGKIEQKWTTPDRVPHRHMWMWDSAFHSLAMSQYNPKLAEEILLAMIKQTRDDGFMPHMANPTDSSDVTQPCVMSFATYKVYEKTHDKEFLKEAIPYLEKYLNFDMNYRDKNKNGLLEWYTEPDYQECKCGESGLDNSPRFDFDEEMDCLDFSSYFALDTEYLSKIYKEIGDEEMANKWEEISNRTKDKIKELLWDEEDGMYYDRLFSNKLTKVLTHSSFLPMFIGIASKEQAARMVETLKDKTLLWSTLPVASISQKDPRFSNDMWRGGVWLNLNYFIIVGLKKYGYEKEADELIKVTLDSVNKWYKKTGCIFEFYDPKDEISPFYCHRKGNPLKKPDYRKHVHSISDYNWSACFTMLMIQGIY